MTKKKMQLSHLAVYIYFLAMWNVYMVSAAVIDRIDTPDHFKLLMWKTTVEELCETKFTHLKMKRTNITNAKKIATFIYQNLYMIEAYNSDFGSSY